MLPTTWIATSSATTSAIAYDALRTSLARLRLRAISSGDAIRLSQVLNPDDIDFPVERAGEMIGAYRQRYRETASIRADFVDVGPNGDEVTEMIELGFGDGLIGIRGLSE